MSVPRVCSLKRVAFLKKPCVIVCVCWFLFVPEEVEGSHQRDDGALRSELSRTEQRPDKPIDVPLLRLVLVVVRRHLGLLSEEEEEEHRDTARKILRRLKWREMQVLTDEVLLKEGEAFRQICQAAFLRLRL